MFLEEEVPYTTIQCVVQVWPRPTLDWHIMQCYITLMFLEETTVRSFLYYNTVCCTSVTKARTGLTHHAVLYHINVSGRNYSQKFPILQYRKSLIQTRWDLRVSIRKTKCKQYYCTHSRVLSIGFLSPDQFSRDQLSQDQLSRDQLSRDQLAMRSIVTRSTLTKSTLTRSTQFYYVKINMRVDLVAIDLVRIDLVTPSLSI